MKLHKVKCDACGAEADMRYNGEHHICPAGWFELYEDHTHSAKDIHLCPDCNPKKKKKEEKESL